MALPAIIFAVRLGCLGAVALLAVAASASTPVVESRLAELQTRFDAHRIAREWDAAVAVLDEMSRLDRDHPRIYVSAATLLMQEKSFEAAALWARFGPDGPGRRLGGGVMAFFERRDGEAGRLLGEAVALYQELGHLAGQATAHTMLGLVLRRQSRLTEATAELEIALALQERIGDPLAQADIVSNLGKVELDAGRPSEALALQRRALALREAERDLASQGKSWQEIGRTLAVTGDNAGAIPAFERALELRRATGDRLTQLSTLREIGRLHGLLGNWDEAAAAHAEAAALAEQLGDPVRRAQALVGLGELLLLAERIPEAVEALRSAATLFAETGKAIEEARALKGIGSALKRLNEFEAANAALERALALARAARDEALEAQVLSAQGGVHVARGQLAAALVALERAREICHRRENRQDEVTALNNLGVVDQRLNDPERARRRFEGGLELAGGLGERRWEALLRSNLGVVLADAGKLDEALLHEGSSIALWEELGDERGLALARFNAADVLWRLVRRGEARAQLDQALEIFGRLGDHEGEAFTLNLLAAFQDDEGKRDEALGTYGRSLEISRKHGLARQEWVSRAGRAALLEQGGRHASALAEYRSAVDVVETLRTRAETGELKMRFLSDKLDLFERAIALELRTEGMAAGAPATFRLAERARARSLVDLLAEARAGLRTSLPAALIGRETAMLDAISSASARLAAATSAEDSAAVRRELDVAEEQLGLLQVEIRQESPIYGHVAYPEAASLAEIQDDVLRPDEALLSYFIGADEAWLWVVERDAVRIERLVSPSEIRKLVTSFLDAGSRAGLRLGEPLPGAAEAEALGAALLPGAIGAGRRLLVAPYGPLHHVPFEALRRHGRWLVEDHEVVVVPSATALSVMRRHPVRTAPGGFLGAGAPVVEDAGDGFAPLAHSRPALESIAALFPPGERHLLLGPAFTRAALRDQPLAEMRYLHLAAHGWLDSQNPRYFGLRTSDPPGGGPGEFLHMDDVFSMRLAAELVVLSACRSGLGEMLRGEGLLSMTRAFLYAGARSVLATLWNVDDRTTAEFMEAFYAELRADRPVSDALRRTRLLFIRSDRPALRQPYRWAPFVLVGDPVPDSGSEP
jgi:tetratricopeptide (TPR) repeat protein